MLDRRLMAAKPEAGPGKIIVDVIGIRLQEQRRLMRNKSFVIAAKLR
jgi:hypothetical protein